MRLTYFGHSSFLVETGAGTRVILDPYLHGSFDGAVGYAPIKEAADVVIATHEHDDHAAVDTITGDPQIFIHPTSATIGSLQIKGIDVDHDETGGSERGRNTIVCLDDGEIRLVHLGDLGHVLDDEQAAAIGKMDVLIIPVGGFFTIDAEAAAAVVEKLGPRIVIPIHYKTDSIDFPIATVDGFLETQSDVTRLPESTLEITPDSLPEKRRTIVLTHSL
jgi:L-ascorbate metabolism protein UlaG (beta-lactamase superfamily)